MSLSENQIADLIALRQDLHRKPEISGEEEQTAARIVTELEKLGADRIWQGLGGHGVAAEFRGCSPGETVLFRCELDGLPIHEQSDVPYRSDIAGKGHLCGHDGHMCTILGVGMGLVERDFSGRVILLFQPAEETGQGAQAIVKDPAWAEICPDYAFAYHNVPGRPLSEIGLRSGPGNCASRGMQVLLHGRSSHAAAPQDGVSPAEAMAQLMVALPTLGEATIADPRFALSTLTHVKLGEPTFGIAPGEGEVRATLRCMTDERMEALTDAALHVLSDLPETLAVETRWHDVFPAVVNDPEATRIARTVATTLGMSIHDMTSPMSWSEDFGHFGRDDTRIAILYIGAGEDRPQLHNPDYDFPDDLIAPVCALFLEIARHLLNDSNHV